MELDTQVEQTVLPDTSNPEHKRKHRSKDKHKHKHKHHKKSKRDRHANVDGDLPDEESGPVEVAAPTGFEDGELPGPPSTAHDSQPALVNGSADLSSADAVDKLSAEQQPSTSQPELRSNEQTRTDSGKLSTVVEHAASPSRQPVATAGNLDTATDVSVNRSAGAGTSAHQLNGHSRSGREPTDPSGRDKSHHRSHTRHDSSRGLHDTEKQSSERHTQSSSQRPSDSSRHHRNSSRQRSSSQRPKEPVPPDSQHRSSQRESRTVQDSRRGAQHASAGGADFRRPVDRAEGRRPDRDSRQHGRDNLREARPHGRGYDRAYDRRDDRAYDRRDDRAYDRRDDRYGGRHPSQSRNRPRDRDGDRDKRKRDDKADKEAEQEFVAKVEAALQSNEVDEDRLIEERRRRRQEILAKHQQDQQADAGPAMSVSAASGPSAGSPQHSAPVQPSPSRGAPSPAATQSVGVPCSESAQSIHDSDATAHVDVLAELPDEGATVRGTDGAASPSISDEEEYQKLDSASLWQQGQSHAASNGMPAGTVPAPDVEPEVQLAGMDDREVPRQAAEEAQQAAPAVPAKSTAIGGLDMFADELDADMFSDAPMVASAVAPEKKALLDNYDDAEGYYNFQVGEIMDGRYEVFATHGKGVFSSVLRARDKQNPVPGTEVAIKMIRANETMYKAAQTEKVVLRKLAGADPEGRRHCIKLLRTFEYRSHLCLVLEAMDINLRELTKKYGRGIGLNIAAVSKYAAQMLISLYHLRNCGVLHADVKPDNILVSASRTMVKLADFGSAMFSGDNEITPYLVSRFYRAPEVILGLKYDHALDIWSVGCVIYELFTGAILFPGQTNNQMLKLMMDVKGPFPKKMLKKGVFTDRHFEDDPNMSFALLEEDQVTRRPIRRTIAAPHIKKDFAGLLAGSEGPRKKVIQLADLLERMMALDPDKRITPKDALKHPFIKETAL